METVKIKTFSDYQQAAMRTCTESSNNTDYMELGLMGEVGEVCGKLAKAIRDDNSKLTDSRKEELAFEVGDVAWMLAGYDHVKGFDWSDEDVDDTVGSIKDANVMQAIGYGLYCEISVFFNNSGEFHRSVLISILRNLASACGYSLRGVLQANIDKLTDRYNRNKIQGNGDYR